MQSVFHHGKTLKREYSAAVSLPLVRHLNGRAPIESVQCLTIAHVNNRKDGMSLFAFMEIRSLSSATYVSTDGSINWRYPKTCACRLLRVASEVSEASEKRMRRQPFRGGRALIQFLSHLLFRLDV